MFSTLLARNIFRPGYNMFWIRTLRNQFRARSKRRSNLKSGIPVPPVAIFSITNRCNLNCRGCYAVAQQRDHSKELPLVRINGIFKEAAECGTGIIIIAGGEPLIRKDVLKVAAANREIIFPVFSNGTMLDSEYVGFFSQNPNMIPVLSIEGNPVRTDSRRGLGIYRQVLERAESLYSNRVFYGLSITLTSENFEEVMRPGFINGFYEKGCRLFFFVEYVPSSEDDISRCLTEQQKRRLSARLDNMRLIFSSLFIALPGDEQRYGGCMAAGRGFIHISSTGNLEPCPFAPFSDVNLGHTGYRDALRSPLLENIRDNHFELGESRGGCALRENSEWVAGQTGTKAV